MIFQSNNLRRINDSVKELKDETIKLRRKVELEAKEKERERVRKITAMMVENQIKKENHSNMDLQEYERFLFSASQLYFHRFAVDRHKGESHESSVLVSVGGKTTRLKLNN